MFQQKEDFLRLNPEDEVFIGQVKGQNHIEINESLELLTLTFPKNPKVYAIALSDNEAVKLFCESNRIEKLKIRFQKIKVKVLLPLLMTSRMNLLVDPFKEDLIEISPKDMLLYCEVHENEIFSGDLNNLSYLNFRVARAKAQGGNVQQKLLKDLAERDVFYVAASSIQPISPFVSTIGLFDMRKYIMVFSDADVAKRFCDHIAVDSNQMLIPVRVKVEVLLLLVERNPDVGIDMFYLNDGAEGMPFSYHDLAIVQKKQS